MSTGAWKSSCAFASARGSFTSPIQLPSSRFFGCCFGDYLARVLVMLSCTAGSTSNLFTHVYSPFLLARMRYSHTFVLFVSSHSPCY